jgi:hypothetical protein
MPNVKLNVNDSLWLNYMREYRRKYPELDHVSRKISYPHIAKSYREFKTTDYYNLELPKRQQLNNMVKYIRSL